MRVILQHTVEEVVRGFDQGAAASYVAEAALPYPGPETVVSDRPVAVDDGAINQARRPTRLDESARRDECDSESLTARVGQPVFGIWHLEPEAAGTPIILKMRRRPFNFDILWRPVLRLFNRGRTASGDGQDVVSAGQFCDVSLNATEIAGGAPRFLWPRALLFGPIVRVIVEEQVERPQASRGAAGDFRRIQTHIAE